MQKKIDAFKHLLNIMDDLRAQCPWDKKQTIHTLRNLTIEETYELADAIIKKDYKEKLIPSFLNIQDISSIDFSDIKIQNRQELLSKRDFKTLDEMRDRLKSFDKNKEGVVYKDFLDYMEKSDVYVAFEPNQIKSVFNKGEFSEKRDNIYYQKESKSLERNRTVTFFLYSPLVNSNCKESFSIGVYQ